MNAISLALLPSWWMTAPTVLAVAVVIFYTYRRTVVPLPSVRLASLAVLRSLAVAALLLVAFRPVARLSPPSSNQIVVPVLVDVSGSMRIADADGLTRLARARAIAQFELLPVLAKKYAAPIVEVGDAHGSDLSGAIASVRERFRGQRVAAVVLVSDGADTGGPAARRTQSVPVFAVGVGAPAGLRDREVVSVAAGDPRLTDASVDLDVSASSSGFGRAPYEIRLHANGSQIAVRRVTPAGDVSSDHVRFTVVPDPARATVYTAEIPAASDEAVPENNAQSVLVPAAGRKRRVLVIAGAPGFEHSFMTRAWAADPGLDVDAVVRKGKNADGRDTFVIQAPADRTQPLSAGFPQRREDLFAYDALVLANIEGSFFTSAQLSMIADFVGERGGGLLVAGSRSLSQRGLIGTPLEAVLPVELDPRRAGVARASLDIAGRTAPNQLVVTADGEMHPIMRLGASGEDTRTKWAALPALADAVPLGQPRPGAVVLAVIASADGDVSPVVAVQRYGEGRSMIFGGEGSWRWRMLAASGDRSHELFWRQAARWLAGASPDPVSLSVPDALVPGEAASLEIVTRNAAFTPADGVRVAAAVSRDGGRAQTLAVRRIAAGRFAADFTPDQAGVYRVHVDGAADRTVLAGGREREFADPRLNEAFLRRLARDSGGRYARASDAARVLASLDETAAPRAEPALRDLWDRPWVIVSIAILLCAEWTLRRRWGLR